MLHETGEAFQGYLELRAEQLEALQAVGMTCKMRGLSRALPPTNRVPGAEHAELKGLQREKIE